MTTPGGFASFVGVAGSRQARPCSPCRPRNFRRRTNPGNRRTSPAGLPARSGCRVRSRCWWSRPRRTARLQCVSAHGYGSNRPLRRARCREAVRSVAENNWFRCQISGKLAVIDAQSLLERPEGEFQPCGSRPSSWLTAELPVTPDPQVLPDDLVACLLRAAPPPPATACSRTPAVCAVDDGRCSSADATAPPSTSWTDQSLRAGGGHGALYPLATKRATHRDDLARGRQPAHALGKRFVYDVDQFDWPRPGVMAFDVSPARPNARRSCDRARLPAVRGGGIASSSMVAPGYWRFCCAIDPRSIRPPAAPVIGEMCDQDPRNTDSLVRCIATASVTRLVREQSELRGVFASVLSPHGAGRLRRRRGLRRAVSEALDGEIEATEDFRGCKNDPSALPLRSRRASSRRNGSRVQP